jgi:hypothetical protein
MIKSQMERQEIEEQERECRRAEREERLAELKIFKGRRGSKSWERRKGKGGVTERKKEESELRIGKLKGT